MDVLRDLLLLTDGRNAFFQRAPPAVNCRTTCVCQPPNLRKLLAGLMSILVLLASPSAAGPVLARSRRSVNNAAYTTETRHSAARFFGKVSKPCQSDDIITRTNSQTNADLVSSFFAIIWGLSLNIKAQADGLINEGLGSCLTLDLDPWQQIPTADEFTAMNTTALESAYRLLVYHAAAVLYLEEQDKLYAQACADSGIDSSQLGEQLKTLFSYLHNTMCSTIDVSQTMDLGINFDRARGQGLDLLDLDHVLTDLPECSTRLTMACRVIKSVERLVYHYSEFVKPLMPHG